MGPVSEILYFRDYWFPESIFPLYIGKFPFMIEDVIFGFSIGGIAAVIFEVFLKRKLRTLSTHTKHSIKLLTIVFIFTTVLLITLALGANSIYASSLGFLVAGITIVYVRHDLLLDAVGSGVLVMLIMFVSYVALFNFVANTDDILKQGWLLYGSNLDSRIAGVPVTEMSWGFTWGFLAAPWFEFMNGKKTVAFHAKKIGPKSPK